MASRKEIMHQLVKEEARNLRKNATQEELDKLDFSYLDPQHTQQCIYGQIAGGCFSDRSVELIKKCASRVYKTQDDGDIRHSKLNGSPINKKREKFWSPIEVFIDQGGENSERNNKALVRYLKGETRRLVLI